MLEPAGPPRLAGFSPLPPVRTGALRSGAPEVLEDGDEMTSAGGADACNVVGDYTVSVWPLGPRHISSPNRFG